MDIRKAMCVIYLMKQDCICYSIMLCVNGAEKTKILRGECEPDTGNSCNFTSMHVCCKTKQALISNSIEQNMVHGLFRSSFQVMNGSVCII